MTTSKPVLAARSRPSFADDDNNLHPQVSRGEQSADRRIQPMSAPHQTGVAACRCRGAEARRGQVDAKLRNLSAWGALACRRSARLSPELSHPGSAPGHASWDWSKRALPALSRPSAGKAPPASVIVPRGMMPEAAPAQVASPRGSTALAPQSGSHPDAPLGRARFDALCNYNGDKCQGQCHCLSDGR